MQLEVVADAYKWLKIQILQPEWVEHTIIPTTSSLDGVWILILIGFSEDGQTIIIPPLARSSLLVCKRSNLKTIDDSCIGRSLSSSCLITNDVLQLCHLRHIKDWVPPN